MANYNTFVVVDYNKRKNILVTSSARKADSCLRLGTKVEVWNDNELVEVIYFAKYKYCRDYMWPYLQEEKKYIQKKQEIAQKRNANRRLKQERKSQNV